MTYAERQLQIELQRQRARRTRFMNGWDAAIAQREPQANPYTRYDTRRDWERGFQACMANQPLPWWYTEWRNPR